MRGQYTFEYLNISWLFKVVGLIVFILVRLCWPCWQHWPWNIIRSSSFWSRSTSCSALMTGWDGWAWVCALGLARVSLLIEDSVYKNTSHKYMYSQTCFMPRSHINQAPYDFPYLAACRGFRDRTGTVRFSFLRHVWSHILRRPGGARRKLVEWNARRP